VIQATGAEVAELRLIFVQTVEPYDIAVVTLGDDWLGDADWRVWPVAAGAALDHQTGARRKRANGQVEAEKRLTATG